MSRFVHVLSVRQPWAWLICAGFKDAENRTWKTGFRGELYIHAGLRFDWETMDRLEREMPDVAEKIKKHFGIGWTWKKGGILDCDMISEFGAIVGRVELVSVVKNSTSRWAEPELYHWIVKNPVQIEPIPLRGQLQIFRAEIPDEIKIIGNMGR